MAKSDSNSSNDRNRALLGTVIIHALLLVCFLLFGLSTPLPLPDEHGVIVSLGYLEAGRGETQPLTATPPVQQSPPATPPSQEPERVVTQDTGESVALPETESDKEIESDTPDFDDHDTATELTEVPEEQPEAEPEPVVDPRALFPGRDQQTTDRQDKGDSTEEGTQGAPAGSVNAIETTGFGPGEGIEYSLTGRSANFLPIPEYSTLATGRVVVQITVNREGQVIRASAGARGTTTTDRTLHRNAEEAARKARFDLKADAPEEQTGTITYNFIRLN